MNTFRNLILSLLLHFVFSAATTAQDKMVVPMVMEGVCPFECCVYTEWSAENDIKVFDNPRDTTLLFMIPEGEEFKAETGNVYIIEPGEIIAKKSFAMAGWRIEANDTL